MTIRFSGTYYLAYLYSYKLEQELGMRAYTERYRKAVADLKAAGIDRSKKFKTSKEADAHAKKMRGVTDFPVFSVEGFGMSL